MAKWAKCQGPSSTAFTDLMKIDGISWPCDHQTLVNPLMTYLQVVEALGLSYKNSDELNCVIDRSLSGCPQFEHYEIMVSDKVCDVYIHNVLACV